MNDHIRPPSRTYLLVATILLAVLTLVAIGFGGGWLVAALSAPGKEAPAVAAITTSIGAPAQMYTCSMHPQIRLPDPNAKCPICGMDLIPVEESDESGDAPILSMSPAAMKLAEIEVTPVRRLLPRVEVRMVGKIDYDETRLATISAYIPGRLDRLFVDFTGIPVSQGDHLVSIYSPDLFTAEAELLSNQETFQKLDAQASETTKKIAAATIQASRDKLRLWGLTGEQIREIERTGIVSDHMTIYSPIGGVVIRKHKVEGEYVATGEPIYSVADLSHLWVRLDAYESDLRWLRYGQDVEFTTEAYPGDVFHGTIAFIDPQVALETRTIKLRVNVANPDGRLKPGMFVRAMVRPVIAGEGRVVADSLAGKFICPMHPEIVKDAQAPCDICGMDLVPAERLGYVSAAGDGERPPLVIPATAPLITGTRAIVYVQLPDRDRPTFEGRQIALGPKAGDFYLVREDGAGGLNLAEGDLVVVRGNFKIDSALQIQARKSMMSPPADQPPPATAPAMASGPVEAAPVVEPVDAPGEFVAGLTPLYDAYLRVQAALAADDLAAFRDAAPAMHAALDAIDASALPPTIRPIWVDLAGRLATQREHVGHLADLDAARGAFETWSNAMIELGRGFGFEGPDQIVIAYCPMAFDFKGASWLQVGQQINNPYFGATMLRCGEVKGTLAAPVRREGIDD